MTFQTVEDVLDKLERHERQARRVINMVPAENSMSALAKLPMILDVYHRYFFNVSGAPEEWNFRGSQDVAGLETTAIDLLRELTGAAYVNLRPLSGLNGMAVVLSALAGGPGSIVLSVSPDQGGHYATPSLAARLGLTSCLITGPDAHTIDYEGVRHTLLSRRPSLIYVDQSNSLFPIELDKLVAVRDEVAPETLLHVDCSHWLGLVLGGQFPNPLTLGADSFGGSTHKTFPGPQKAIIATNRENVWDRIYRAQYEMISSHHFAGVISLGLALLEFKECGGARYAESVLKNTRELGSQLHDRGVGVVAAERGFSRGHQLWIRTAPSGVDAHQASDRLYCAGIRVNVFPALPGIPECAIRIGVNEATYHGLQVEDMSELADVFASALFGREPGDQLADRIARLRARYTHAYGFNTNDGRLLSSVLRLMGAALAPGVADVERVLGAAWRLD